MSENRQTLGNFEPLYPAEIRLVTACKVGEELILGQDRPNQQESEKYIRADLLREIIRSEDLYQGLRENGLRIRNAVIVEDLVIEDMNVGFSIYIIGCIFWSEKYNHYCEIKLNRSIFKGFLCVDACNVKALLADNIRLEGNFLGRKKFESKGRVSFVGAEVYGILSLTNSQIGGGLVFDNASVSGDVFLNGCCSSREVRSLGIKIEGQLLAEKAHFGGNDKALSFDGARIAGGISLNGCYASSVVQFPGAQIGGFFSCKNAKFEGAKSKFNSQGVNINGGLFLDGSVFDGCVDFIDAKIDGPLSCIGASLNSSAFSINLDRATIGGGVVFDGSQARGEVRLLGCSIGGQLSFNEMTLQGKKISLGFDYCQVKGSVFLKSVSSFGELRFCGSKIGGSIDLSGSEILGVLDASHAKISHNFFICELKSPLNNSRFRHAYSKVLEDDKLSWGKDNHLNGFLYECIAHNSPIEASFRVKWLQDQSSDTGSYRPQPWRHLQKTLKAMGHDAEAREIGIAHEKERRRRRVIGQARGSGWFQRLTAQLTGKLHDLYGFFTAYGYEPVRLLYAMLIVWLFCALVYWGAALGGMMGPTSPLVFHNEKYLACMAEWRDWTPNIFVKRSDHNWYFCEKLPGDYTTFSPLMYSLDLLLPLVDLFQDKDWGVQIPTPRDDIFEEYAAAPSQYLVRLVVWLEILFGWMASLMLVAVISGMARNTRDDE